MHSINGTLHGGDPVRRRQVQPPAALRPLGAEAFTLVEVLVVMFVVALLLSVLLPSLRSVRAATKTVVCSSNMKTVSMDFHLFATGQSSLGRGDSNRLPANRFWITDFQESVYGLDEFWDAGNASTGTVSASQSTILCPAGAPTLTKRRGIPCGREALSPIEDVSVAFNMRLYRAPFEVKGKRLLASTGATRISSRVIDYSHVPLLLDADGQAAIRRGIEPFYSAPPVAASDPYSTGRYWFPKLRHAGKAVVGFVGGHVLASPQPERENWDWSYHAETGN